MSIGEDLVKSGVIRLCEEWRHCFDDQSNSLDPAFDDSHWQTTHVPHGGRELGNELPRSTREVWFRKSFDMP